MKSEERRRWLSWSGEGELLSWRKLQNLQDTVGLFVWHAEKGQKCIHQNSKIGSRTHFEAPSLNKPTVSLQDLTSAVSRLSNSEQDHCRIQYPDDIVSEQERSLGNIVQQHKG